MASRRPTVRARPRRGLGGVREGGTGGTLSQLGVVARRRQQAEVSASMVAAAPPRPGATGSKWAPATRQTTSGVAPTTTDQDVEGGDDPAGRAFEHMLRPAPALLKERVADLSLVAHDERVDSGERVFQGPSSSRTCDEQRGVERPGRGMGWVRGGAKGCDGAFSAETRPSSSRTHLLPKEAPPMPGRAPS